MIPWVDIQHWADVHRLPEAQTADLHTHIRVLDLAFLTWKAARDARDKKAKEA